MYTYMYICTHTHRIIHICFTIYITHLRPSRLPFCLLVASRFVEPEAENRFCIRHRTADFVSSNETGIFHDILFYRRNYDSHIGLNMTYMWLVGYLVGYSSLYRKGYNQGTKRMKWCYRAVRGRWRWSSCQYL